MLRESLYLSAVVILLALVIRCRRRWSRLTEGYRLLEEYADSLLQHGQGTVLNINGIIVELNANDPVRRRIEHALSRAERELGELRETMQPQCSEQQQDAIR